MTGTAPLLQVDDLSVELLTDRGWATVVDRVSFDVARGETVALVGESGSGKTVTSMTVMGLLPNPPARVVGGAVRLGGVDLLGLSRRELEDVRGAQISMVFQEPMTSLNPAYTVGDQVAETVRRHRGGSRRAAVQRAVEMLDRVRIPQAARRIDSYPHEFSGGMRQRVMIAMALCCDPSVLIADEPTTALDVTVQAQILDLLKEIQAESGMGMLFITHDLGVVADVSDRVVVMYAGEIVEEARAADLFGAASHPYTAGLLRSVPGPTGAQLYSIPGSPPWLGSFPSGCRFRPRCSLAVDACALEPVAPVQVAAGHSARCGRIELVETIRGGAR